MQQDYQDCYLMTRQSRVLALLFDSISSRPCMPAFQNARAGMIVGLPELLTNEQVHVQSHLIAVLLAINTLILQIGSHLHLSNNLHKARCTTTSGVSLSVPLAHILQVVQVQIDLQHDNDIFARDTDPHACTSPCISTPAPGFYKNCNTSLSLMQTMTPVCTARVQKLRANWGMGGALC